jgi:NAD(P)-dependent dehydrogenase (short-subunit alcohol dehydrogenase family)
VATDGPDEGAGNVAVVTGGSRGIGLAVARRFLADGWRVCITGRREAQLTTSRDALQETGGAVLAFAGAAEDEEHQASVVEAVLARFGRVDVLVNNAAASPFYGPMLEASPEQFIRALSVNVVAPWSWIRTVTKMYMAEHGGSVVNVGSIGGTYPIRNVGLYNTSKAALTHMTKQLALELSPGIRVNAVAPATIKTDFARAKYEGREQEVSDQYPLKRMGTAEEVAGVVAMLCNGSLDWMTGQTIVLDGGASLIQGVV